MEATNLILLAEQQEQRTYLFLLERQIQLDRFVLEFHPKISEKRKSELGYRIIRNQHKADQIRKEVGNGN